MTSVLAQAMQGPLPAPARTPDACVVGPTAEEMGDGRPCWGAGGGSKTFRHAVSTFLASGCAVIPSGVLPKPFALACLARARRDKAFLMKELEARRAEVSSTTMETAHHLAASVHRKDFAELVARDGGRLDIRFQMDRGEFVAPGLIYNPTVYPLVQELLGSGDVQLLYAGIMWAECGSGQTPQKWHGDGGHCFTENGHQPPHCINVFYPLIDMSSELGPTEFMPGTHILGRFDHKDTTAVSLCCKMGGCVLFDYRVKHRGGANICMHQDRPVLYLCYCKTWFRDTGNLRSAKSIVSAGTGSPRWQARVLRGAPMPMGKGFSLDEWGSDKMVRGEEGSSAVPAPAASPASGEQWVLFQMDVELESGVTGTLVCHQGDVATELAAQFCLKHRLADEFIPVLADSIQSQIDACLRTRC